MQIQCQFNGSSVGLKGATRYNNAMDCAEDILKRQGLLGFYRGQIMNFASMVLELPENLLSAPII